MIDLCSSMLARLVNDARNGKLGETAKDRMAAQVSNRAFSCAVKELSVAFSYLMIFDNGGHEMGEQKYNFVSSTLGAIDHIVVGTSVKEILLLNSQVCGYEICDPIAQSVSRLVGGGSCEELRTVISEMLKQSYSIRKTLLFDALNLPSEAILKATAPKCPKAA